MLNKLYPIFLIFNLLITPFSSYADMIFTKNGEKIKGVVLEKTAQETVIESIGRTRTVKNDDIINITYGDELENLILLADSAKNKKELAKAYYLYKRAFLLDPDSKKATEGLASLDGYVFKEGLSETDIVSDYEHYSRNSKKEEADDKILALNAEQTQELIDNFGLVLETVSNKIVIAQIVKGSRADLAGLKNSDVLINIDGFFGDYLGIFDAASFMIQKYREKITVGILREVNIWIDNKDQILLPDLIENAGFSIDPSGDRPLVTKVLPNSEVSYAGIEKGDLLFAINGTNIKGMPPGKPAAIVLQNGPEINKLTFEKKITL